MEMQRERPKPKVKRPQRIIKEQDIQVIKREQVIEPEPEELHSWEDLRPKQQEIDLLYPSAPLLEQEEEVLYPKVPHIISMETEVDYQELIRNHKVVYPSAPLYTDDLDDEYSQRSLEIVKDPEVLKELYQNPLDEEFKTSVEQFLQKDHSGTDIFYQKLKQYQSQIQHLESTKTTLTKLTTALAKQSTKLWTLKRDLVKMKESCPDNWTVYHSYQNERSLFDETLVENYKNLQMQIQHESLISIPLYQFLKIGTKVWIQNEISKTITPEFRLMLKEKQRTQGSYNFTIYKTELQIISGFIDSLFLFVQDPSKEFVQDVQNWIINLSMIIYHSENITLQRRLLLHILRTPGISPWGLLIKFEIPKHNSKDQINNYLICLQAFLGPVEELEELLGQKQNELKIINQEMYRLESEEWIVVDDEIFNTRNNFMSILLKDLDYSMLVCQFNLANYFEYVLQVYILDAKNLEPSKNVEFGDLVMKAFAIAHRFFIIFSRYF
jgi:hypothetical protein